MENPKDYLILSKTKTVVENMNALRKYHHLLNWEGEQEVIDVGCGPGDFTTESLLQYLLQHTKVKKIVGVDASQEMINYALENYGHSSVDFFIMNIEKLSDDELLFKYDKLFSFFCLHWIKNMRMSLQNIYRLLKPGGEAFLLFHTRSDICRSIVQTANLEKWKPYIAKMVKEIGPFNPYNKNTNEFKEDLMFAGFEILSCEVLEKNCKHNRFDMSSFRDLVIGVSPQYHAIPSNLKKEFLDSITSVFINIAQSQNCVTDSEVTESYSLMCAVVRKPVLGEN